MTSQTIAIFGAGSIGVYIGGCLMQAGAEVLMLGRPHMAAQLASYGLHLSDLRGHSHHLQAPRFVTQAQDLRNASLILVCVKSADSANAASSLADLAATDALIISLQNGIGNVETLQAALPKHKVLGGMVPFNVVQDGRGGFHRATEGHIHVARDAKLQTWLAIFHQAGLPLQLCDNFQAVQWGKLLLNLNNPVNALSGQPLRRQLQHRYYRRVLALLIEEALRVLQAAGVPVAQVGKLPPKWLPALLRLPDTVFSCIATSMLRMDDQARSSMWEDLQAGRKTEIDYINGAVVRLAHQHGLRAPYNQRIQNMLHAAENALPALPAFSAEQLLLAMQMPD